MNDTFSTSSLVDPDMLKIALNITVKGNSSGTTVVHIANFADFFKISAFFIAFVLLYLITVPLFMHFIGKSWKVIGGLVAVLRGKGYSTGMVRILNLDVYR